MLKRICFLAILCAFFFLIGHQFSTQKKLENPIQKEYTRTGENLYKTAKAEHQENITFEELPDYAQNTLTYILEHHEPLENYEGGRIYKNREHTLPQFTASEQPIQYHEWDVHPHIQGKNRGAERIVTNNFNQAYWTNNHYKTFKKIIGYVR